MPRVENLFATASIAVLALGLLTTRIAPNQEISFWQGNGVAYGFSLRMPCYGIAALFCVFAFLNAIGYIPFDRSTVQWHFWVTLGSVLLLCAGFEGLRILGQRPVQPPTLGIPGTLVAFSILTSIPIFLVAQAWFAVGLIRAILRMHHR